MTTYNEYTLACKLLNLTFEEMRVFEESIRKRLKFKDAAVPRDYALAEALSSWAENAQKAYSSSR